MVLTKEQRDGFDAVVQPLMQWLRTNCHPHVLVVVDSETANISESSYVTRNPNPHPDDLLAAAAARTE